MRENTDKIAVILLNYNGIEDSIECIESIKKSSVYSKITILFVDNNSNNDETAIINQNYSDVLTFRATENKGFSAGNNIAIKYALENNFGYALLLNNDTVIDSKMIEYLVMNCNEKTIAVPTMYYYYDPSLIWYGGGDINKFTGNAIHLSKDTNDFNENNVIVSFSTGCCMMISSATFKKVGLLPEEYFMYCEDTDYCINLFNKGMKILYVPAAKLWHKVSKSTGGDESAFSIYYMTRNRILYIKKYKNYFHKTALPFTIITRVIRMFQLLLKGKSTWKAFKRGIIDGIKGVKGQVDLKS